MKIFHRLWLVGAVAVLGLTVTASPVAAITNGEYDNGGHPNVGIMYMSELPALVFGFCSGSLLSADEFLVAGHCTAALSAYQAMGLLTPDQVFVSFDEETGFDWETGLISTAHPVAVTGWDTHPQYWYGGDAIVRNDVGVVHLATDVDLTPIDLPAVGFLDTVAAKGGLRGHDFVNVGYGLNSVDRSIFSPQASPTWEHRRMVSETPFLALTPYLLSQQGGVCSGDSGGPHFYGGDLPNLAVAVTSTGTVTCGVQVPGAQRLDTKAVLDFLELYR